MRRGQRFSRRAANAYTDLVAGAYGKRQVTVGGDRCEVCGETEYHGENCAIGWAQWEAQREDDRAPPRRRRSSKPEQNIQRAVLDYLAHCPTVAWAQKMGVGAVRIPDDSTRGYRYVTFGFRGCSDIVGQMTDGRFLAIEVKTVRGEVTDAQQRFLDLVKSHGGVSGVVRSVDDAREVVG